MFNKNEYFERIGFEYRDGENMEEQLIRLHRCHCFSVPWENFRIFCKESVPLTRDDLFEKIVKERTGGYCFELNLLFYELLVSMGYDVRSILCRPYPIDGSVIPLTHRMNVVSLNDKLWLTDIGLGGFGWIEPLELQLDVEQKQFGRTYKITQEPDGSYLVEYSRNGMTAKAVSFFLNYSPECDFLMSHFYTSQHPQSSFVRDLRCTLPTKEGRFTIRNNEITIESKVNTEKIRLKADTIEEVLKKYFGLSLPDHMNVRIREHLLTYSGSN